MSQARPDVDKELAGLKDFQLRTVETVTSRLWDATTRYGDSSSPTRSASARRWWPGGDRRGIDALWDKVDRIDIVYICSNSQIAQQNLARLRVGVDEKELPVAERLTMLAKEIHKLEGRKLNFVSFTPGTSFNVSSGGGQAQERVLLLTGCFMPSTGARSRPSRWRQFFRGGAGIERFTRRLEWFKQHNRAELDQGFIEDFKTALKGAPGPAGGDS